MPESAQLRIAVIGAGPRGTSVVERLIAQLALQPRPTRIELIDPFEPGAGRVWRTSQSEFYLMNTPSFFPTVVPDQEVKTPPLIGWSFNEWRARFAPELKRTDFPTRALYGRYLRWTFEYLQGHLPPGVELHWHAAEATAVRRTAASLDVELSNGERLSVNSVVLALGHLQSRLGSEQAGFAAAAERWSLKYVPPAIPADIDWTETPAAEPVLVRGMGLNFFDLVSQWTEGRGGRYAQTTEGLQYLPSGAEPTIIAVSRRGGPYRAKASWDTLYPRSVQLEFLPAVLAQSWASPPGFDHDLWPALRKDTIWSYYSTLLSEQEARPLAAILRDPQWQRGLAEFEAEIPPDKRLDIESLAKPFLGRNFASPAEFRQAVLTELDADVLGSAAGESDPVKMAIGTLNEGRALLKEFVADGGIAEESWLGELRGWFEPLIEGLASGPPALRIAQLAAVIRAGVVRVVGPDPVFTVDDRGFSVSSPWVAESAVRSRWLVEAMAPANRVLQSGSMLMRQLLRDGLVRPKTMLTFEDVPVATSGLDVSLPPYRALTLDGVVQADLFVIGLQLSSVQWGTANAAEATADYRSGYRTLLDAEAIAAAILRPS